MSNDDATNGGHTGCLEQKNARSQNEQCIKCGKEIDTDIVYHDYCMGDVYSGYTPPIINI